MQLQHHRLCDNTERRSACITALLARRGLVYGLWTCRPHGRDSRRVASCPGPRKMSRPRLLQRTARRSAQRKASWWTQPDLHRRLLRHPRVCGSSRYQRAPPKAAGPLPLLLGSSTTRRYAASSGPPSPTGVHTDQRTSSLLLPSTSKCRQPNLKPFDCQCTVGRIG